MPISTNSFLAVVESTDSTALANKEASISSCTEFDEKYGRRCVSINEMNIQNASSSGDCNSSCPAINTSPTQKNISLIHTSNAKLPTHLGYTGYLAPWSDTTAKAIPTVHRVLRGAYRSQNTLARRVGYAQRQPRDHVPRAAHISPRYA